MEKQSIMRVDTICAPATPAGKGGVSMARVSGPSALAAAASLGDASVARMGSHTLKLVTLKDEEGIINQAVVAYYKAPRSYTGEDVVEFAVHGSPYIVQRLMRALSVLGVRSAEAGEFTKRAFLNGRMDLSQAEAVADLIAGETKEAHDLALRQLRGGFSSEIENLRLKLLDFASLVELELDFGEEDVEFADRTRLRELLREIGSKVDVMRASFRLGNAIKEGIPVAIIGKPNAGKSTLLNALLLEERALVSDVPGTTRDTIEEVWQVEGMKFRFIDTAGLRQSPDEVERMGIERTLRKMGQARVWFYLFDAGTMGVEEAREEVAGYLASLAGVGEPGREAGQDGLELPSVVLVANKIDKAGLSVGREGDVLYISAKQGLGLDLLEDALRELMPVLPDENTLVVSNARHDEALGLVQADLRKVEEGLDMEIPGDLLAMDIRSAIEHLGQITGKILADDILGNVFSRFCIGK